MDSSIESSSTGFHDTELAVEHWILQWKLLAAHAPALVQVDLLLILHYITSTVYVAVGEKLGFK